ncbi:MAG: hypothetical protein PHP12_05750, partial [Bacilli bacterium]|nr:hypothetical protein [Bacilli bacterium]
SISIIDALENTETNFNDLLRKFTEKSIFTDGGTKHYTDKALHSLFGISSTKYNAENGDNNIIQNIYIGPMYMHYENEFCKK